MGRSQEKGREGEKIASRYLLKRGYSIIRRNYRSSYGEIDIIAFDPSTKTIVFVEVKLRKKGAQSTPLETVNRTKQKKIIKTALKFLNETELTYEAVRFDVIGIEDGEISTVFHVEDAFQLNC
ncbi:YraN family protein [Phorcysia thermohydrogeniphila]|uniref:YraN family protein n=1 Tax=Phorcysia thermohydrogeniphila TaxID=936138 RepID=UPI001046906B|nr:YraN family protein [Phorcysia thermohydrogeniphila]